MVLVKPHIRLSWGGTLGTPASEVWTNSLAFTGVTDGDSESYTRDGLVAMLPEVRTALTDWITIGDSMIDTSAALTWIKLNKIGVDGKYLDNPNTLEGLNIRATTGFKGTIWQQSAVVSLRTGQERGRGSKGRIYPPVCGAGVAADGYMTAVIASSIQSAAVKLIGDLNKILGPDHLTVVGTKAKWNVCIVSNEINGKLPLLTPVTNLYVDRVPDVQRRRVNRLPVLGVAPTSVYINT